MSGRSTSKLPGPPHSFPSQTTTRVVRLQKIQLDVPLTPTALGDKRWFMVVVNFEATSNKALVYANAIPGGGSGNRTS
jgi:hypothetical protein